MGILFCRLVVFCLVFLFPFLLSLVGTIPPVYLWAPMGALLFDEYILLLLIKIIIIIITRSTKNKILDQESTTNTYLNS